MFKYLYYSGYILGNTKPRFLPFLAAILYFKMAAVTDLHKFLYFWNYFSMAFQPMVLSIGHH